MAFSDPKVNKEEEEDFKEDGESGTERYDSDDSDEDPTYDILEETRLSLSNLSVKKSKSRISKEVDSGSEEDLKILEVKVPKLDKNDEKCFEKIEKIIQAGQLDKLKVDNCKLYLRKYGLRLTGKKDVLVERIREHLEVIDGGGEKKYPISSFVLNCKGDACTGDVVMFEQNVYEMYSIASRSATGPPCGTRIVVGRIVKESYGASKQQHTFTIEVLWSRGEKPLPPLHPLLIKGRNLYRLKTMRQQWADEDERKKVLSEKHSRGYMARCCRETRIEEKEMRKGASNQSCAFRVKRKENNSSIQGQSDQLRRNPIQWSEFQQKHHDNSTGIPPNPNNSTGIPPNLYASQNSVTTTEHRSSAPQFPVHGLQKQRPTIYEQRHTNMSTGFHRLNTQLQQSDFARRNSVIATEKHIFPVDARFHHHRQPLTSLNSQLPPSSSPWRRPMSHQRCRYYPQGSCHYGDRCKFLHE